MQESSEATLPHETGHPRGNTMVRAARSILNMQSGSVVTLGESGLTGIVAEVPDDHTVVIRIGDELQGQPVKHMSVAADAIQQRADGSFHLPLDREQVQRIERERGVADASGRMVVPLAEEQLHIDRRTVRTGGVKVDKTVSRHEETVEEPVISEEAQVRTVPVNRIIDTPAEIREEGDELIVPLMEEVLVVEKKLMLREELRISKKRSERREPQTYTLRREEASVQRTPEQSNPNPSP